MSLWEKKTQRIELDEYDERLKGYWVEVIHPDYMPWGLVNKVMSLFTEMRQKYDIQSLPGVGDGAEEQLAEQLSEKISPEDAILLAQVQVEAAQDVIIGWNLHNPDGEQLPPPSEDPDVFDRLPRWVVPILLEVALDAITEANAPLAKGSSPASTPSSTRGQGSRRRGTKKSR